VGKINFITFGPLRKVLENPLMRPLEKILPTPMLTAPAFIIFLACTHIHIQVFSLRKGDAVGSIGKVFNRQSIWRRSTHRQLL